MSRSKWIAVPFAAAVSFAVFADQPGQAGTNAKNAQQDQSGEAVVVTRDGPAIAIENGEQPIIAVAFAQGKAQLPAAGAQQQQAQNAGQGVEVSILIANPNEAAKPTEVLFESNNAPNGMVVFTGNEIGHTQTASAQQPPAQPGQANAKEKQTQLIFSARVNGRTAKVTELVGQGNARILVVKHEDQAQAKAAQPAQPGQPQPAAAKEAGQKEKAQAEQNEAVIFVYLRGEQAK
jgi:hypothetical protein